MKTLSYPIINLLLISLLANISACKKVEVGYLSENLRYGSNPISVDRGVFKLNIGIIPDNSTPPFKVTLINVRNKTTGLREESFFKESPITVWTQRYDPTTDTTFALIEAKRTTENSLPLLVLEKSGQLVFTQATESVPAGEYFLDLEVENSSGKKRYNAITTIKMNDPVTFEHINAPYYILVDPSNGNSIRYPHDVDWFDIAKQQSGSIQFKVTRDANGPNQIILKVYDKEGNLFPGKALERRPSGNSFLNTMSTFAYKTTVTDTAVIHDYAQARFPDLYWDSQTNGILCYYRIYDKWIENVDYVDSWNPPNSVTYKTDPKSYILQVRFGLKFNLPGTYICEMHVKAKKKANVN